MIETIEFYEKVDELILAYQAKLALIVDRDRWYIYRDSQHYCKLPDERVSVEQQWHLHYHRTIYLMLIAELPARKKW